MSKYIKWGVAGVAALGVAYWMTPDSGEEDALIAAKKISKDVSADVLKAQELTDAQRAEQYEYRVDDLLKELQRSLKKLESLHGKSATLVEYVQSKGAEPQPQYVIDDCKVRLAQVKTNNDEVAAEKRRAESLYISTLREWSLRAAEPDKEAEHIAAMEALVAKLEELAEKVEARKKNTKSGWEARTIYTRAAKRIKRNLNALKAETAARKEFAAAAMESKRMVIGEEGAADHSNVMHCKATDCKVNHGTSKMKEIDGVLAAILGYEASNADVALPALKPEPKPLPPPEFKPDLVLTATGDLGSVLLEPLVEQWLVHHKATALRGSQFTWNLSKGNKELEVNAPAGIQGAEPGKLRIRIVPSDSPAAAFNAVSADGVADLMLTGATPNAEMLAQWLPAGETLESLGRSFKARICYDALVFLRGSGMDLQTLRSAQLKNLPKVYSVGDAARMEAASVFKMEPTAADAQETAALSREELCSAHADKMVLGVWHKDAGRSISISNIPTIRYAAGWESEDAYKNVPEEYRPMTDGVSPTAENIASGRYAYAYSIYGYRRTECSNARRAELAAGLLAFIADAENKEVARVTRDNGFVPVEVGVAANSRYHKLTRDDLPIPVLLRAMGDKAEEYGYDAEESTWVYGVRIPFALYFEKGSAKNSSDAVQLDADAEYYTSTEAFASIKSLAEKGKAMLVVVGHADIQHGGLSVDAKSWKYNLKLSQQRADFADKLLQKKMPGSGKLDHKAIGSGWARPACDISLVKPATAQVSELARCRRAEVYIIFPVAD